MCSQDSLQMIRHSEELELHVSWQSSRWMPITLRWQLFAGTFFYDFGLKHLLRVLNFSIFNLYAEMVQDQQILIFYTTIVHHVADDYGYIILRFWANPQKYQTLVPQKVDLPLSVQRLSEWRRRWGALVQPNTWVLTGRFQSPKNRWAFTTLFGPFELQVMCRSGYTMYPENNERGSSLTNVKIEAVLHYKQPVTKMKVKAFLGLAAAGYNQKFLHLCSSHWAAKEE